MIRVRVNKEAIKKGNTAKMTLPTEIELLYDFITVNANSTMGIADEGLVKGAVADIVVLYGVKTPWDAIRLLPTERTVIRKGKIIAESQTTIKKHY